LIALVEEGDQIRIDINQNRLDLLVDEEVLAQRKQKWTKPELRIKTGYMRRYAEMVQSANTGAIFKK